MLPVCHQQTKTEIKTFKPLGHVLYPAARVICMSLDCEGETPGGNQGVGEHHCPSCEIHLQRKRGKGSTGWEADLLQLSKCDNLTGIVLNLHHSGWSWQTATLRLSIRYAWHRQVKYSLSLEKRKSYITVLPAPPPFNHLFFLPLKVRVSLRTSTASQNMSWPDVWPNNARQIYVRWCIYNHDAVLFSIVRASLPSLIPPQRKMKFRRTMFLLIWKESTTATYLFESTNPVFSS